MDHMIHVKYFFYLIAILHITTLEANYNSYKSLHGMKGVEVRQNHSIIAHTKITT